MDEYKGITGKNSKYISEIFFIIGLFAALGIRLVLMLNQINSFLASAVWYAAMVFYLMFFAFRLYIEEKRRKLVIENRLRQKLLRNRLTRDDRHQIKTLLDSILVSKLYWNMIALLIITASVLVIQIIIDL